MVGITAISGVVGALNGAVSISKAILGLRDEVLIQAKVIELNGEILSAQQRAFDANTEHLALLTGVSDLEKQVADMETWNAEKAKYELRQVSSFGSYAYTLKIADGPEPRHYLCATCYDRGKKSVLQGTTVLEMRRRMFTCANCSTRIPIEGPSGGTPSEA